VFMVFASVCAFLMDVLFGIQRAFPQPIAVNPAVQPTKGKASESRSTCDMSREDYACPGNDQKHSASIAPVGSLCTKSPTQRGCAKKMVKCSLCLLWRLPSCWDGLLGSRRGSCPQIPASPMVKPTGEEKTECHSNCDRADEGNALPGHRGKFSAGIMPVHMPSRRSQCMRSPAQRRYATKPGKCSWCLPWCVPSRWDGVFKSSTSSPPQFPVSPLGNVLQGRSKESKSTGGTSHEDHACPGHDHTFSGNIVPVHSPCMRSSTQGRKKAGNCFLCWPWCLPSCWDGLLSSHKGPLPPTLASPYVCLTLRDTSEFKSTCDAACEGNSSTGHGRAGFVSLGASLGLQSNYETDSADATLPDTVDFGFAVVNQRFSKGTGLSFVEIIAQDEELGWEKMVEMLQFMDAFVDSENGKHHFSLFLDLRRLRLPPVSMVLYIAEWGHCTERIQKWYSCNCGCKILIQSGLRYWLVRWMLMPIFATVPPPCKVQICTEINQPEGDTIIFDPETTEDQDNFVRSANSLFRIDKNCSEVSIELDNEGRFTRLKHGAGQIRCDDVTTSASDQGDTLGSFSATSSEIGDHPFTIDWQQFIAHTGTEGEAWFSEHGYRLINRNGWDDDIVDSDFHSNSGHRYTHLWGLLGLSGFGSDG